MPVYVYKCERCGKKRDVKHAVAEKISIRCDRPTCGGECKKTITSIPIHYRTGGFAKGNDLK